MSLKSWNDKCALFGIWNSDSASLFAYFGLYAQQHRGQEGAGIVSLDQSSQPPQHYIQKGLGLVGDVFDSDSLQELKGRSAIGHTRYSTRGRSQDEKSIQPLTTQIHSQPAALAHNGNLVNFEQLQKKLSQAGVQFQGTGDTECLIHLFHQESQSSSSFVEILQRSLSQVEGAYSLVLLTHESLIAVRDPRGFRPLVLGQKKLDSGLNSWITASETCALDLLGAQYEREIQPGEILVISKNKSPESYFLKKKEKRRACVFEHVYFARPDSIVFGKSVYETRKQLGRALARQAPAKADLVIPIPDSGVASALGYSQESSIPFELGIIRNHYVGRTFIHPNPGMRNFRVKIKLSPQKYLIKNKRVIVIDDSLVRGTTSRSIVKILRQAGALEIHFRIASPPVTDPCLYGIDTPRKEELISSHKNLKEIKEFLQVDSIEFLSIENLIQTVDVKQQGYCRACFTGRYPTPVPF